MPHIIMCRLCKQRFDTEKEPFVIVGKQSYYHKECYDTWVTNRNDANAVETEDFWYESMIDYLYRDVHLQMDFQKIESQWNNFIKPDRKMTPKGIYFALKYFYEIQKGDKSKALGGIGIVTSIYNESAKYWTELEIKKTGTIEAIIEQIRARDARPVSTIIRQSRKKKKEQWSIDNV